MFITVWQSKLHRNVRYSTFQIIWRVNDPIWMQIPLKTIFLLCHVKLLKYIFCFISKSYFCSLKLPTWKHINIKIIFYQFFKKLMWFLTIEAMIKTLHCCHLAAQLRTCWDFIENICVKQTLFKLKSISTKLHFS